MFPRESKVSQYVNICMPGSEATCLSTSGWEAIVEVIVPRDEAVQKKVALMIKWPLQNRFHADLYVFTKTANSASPHPHTIPAGDLDDGAQQQRCESKEEEGSSKLGGKPFVREGRSENEKAQDVEGHLYRF